MSRNLILLLFPALVFPVFADPDAGKIAGPDWRQIRQKIRHRVSAAGERFEADNPAQQIRAAFDRRGFTIEPRAGNWRWGLELERYGFGRWERPVSGPAAAHAAGTRVTYRWPDGVEEWYENAPEGIEHGFTVRKRPAVAPGPLHLDLAVRGGLVPSGSGDAAAVFTEREGPARVVYTGLHAWDADGVELRSRIETSAGHIRLVVETDGARFPVTVDPVVQQAYLKASNPDAEDNFGWSVAISGNTVVVATPNEDSAGTGVNSPLQGNNSAIRSGAAYVFVKNGGVWTQQAYLKASDSAAGFSFGCSVAIDGDTLVVGAESAAEQINGLPWFVGAAYVFVRSGATWTEQAKLRGSNSNGTNSYGNTYFGGDFFGRSVAVSGDTIVVGAPEEDSSGTGVNGPAQNDNLSRNSGAVYVFTRAGSSWSQQAYLKASVNRSQDYFGSSVAISGNTLVAGAPWEPEPTFPSFGEPGVAFVFVRNAGVWTQQARLDYFGQMRGPAYFGQAVAIEGDTIAVHAPNTFDPATYSTGGPMSSCEMARSGTRRPNCCCRPPCETPLRAQTSWAPFPFRETSSLSGRCARILRTCSRGTAATGR